MRNKIFRSEVLVVFLWLCASCSVSLKIVGEDPETDSERKAIDPLSDAANPSHPILRWRKEQAATRQKAQWATESQKARAAVDKISSGPYFSCATNLKKEIKCWGYDPNGATGRDDSGVDKVNYFESYIGQVRRVVSGQTHTCVLANDSKLTCHGKNTAGQLGDGTTDSTFKPVSPLGFASDVSWVGVNSNRTCAINRTGDLKCWGSGYSQTPQPAFSRLDSVVSVAMGSGHSCLQDANFSAHCWGYNFKGQLGLASNQFSSTSTPFVVDGLTSGVIQVAVGSEHSCALLSGGAVKCWGGNSRGQLGNGTTEDQKSPVEVTGLQSGVTAIALGNEHSCALMNGGGIKCWGLNSSGQLGDGTSENRNVPTDVVGLSAAIEHFSAGPQFTCAIDKDSTAWCWGENSGFNHLGNGTSTDSNVPVKVSNFN
ncbi:MAG: hypothetical protein RLZZ488_1725 [Pseudomonadota bacterium]